MSVSLSTDISHLFTLHSYLTEKTPLTHLKLTHFFWKTSTTKGTFVSRERKGPGTKVPGTRKVSGTKVPHRDYSFLRTKGLGHEKSRCLLHVQRLVSFKFQRPQITFVTSHPCYDTVTLNPSNGTELHGIAVVLLCDEFTV